jgi:hypothetical protein
MRGRMAWTVGTTFLAPPLPTMHILLGPRVSPRTLLPLRPLLILCLYVTQAAIVSQTYDSNGLSLSVCK